MPPKPLAGHRKARQATANNVADLISLSGITGVFTGEKIKGGEKTGRAAVVITVAHKRDVSSAEQIPTTIDGVPTDVREERHRPLLDTALYDPLKGGASASVDVDGFYGTIGLVVTDIATGDPMALSNWHVFYRLGRGAAGDVVVQPAYFDGGRMPGAYVGRVVRGQIGDNVDAALSNIRFRDAKGTIADIGAVTAVGAGVVGMTVEKHGRTTGTTEGEIEATDYTSVVSYGDPVGDVTFNNVLRIVGTAGVFTGPGDSGSVVVDGSTVVGLLTSSSEDGTVAMACNIIDVFDAMNVTLYEAPTGLILTGAEVKAHTDIVEVKLRDGDNVPVSWSISGAFVLKSADSTFMVGVGNPGAPSRYPAFSVEFAGADVDGGGVAFTLTDPSGSTSAGSASFEANVTITFTLTWNATARKLTCQADQAGRTTTSRSRVMVGSPPMMLPYSAVIGASRVGGGDAVNVTRLHADRDCGVEGDGGIIGGTVYTPSAGNWTTNYGVVSYPIDGSIIMNDVADAEAEYDDENFPFLSAERFRWTGHIDFSTSDSVFVQFLLQAEDYSTYTYFELLKWEGFDEYIAVTGFSLDGGFDQDLFSIPASGDFTIDWNPTTGFVTATYGGSTVSTDIGTWPGANIVPRLAHGSAGSMNLTVSDIEFEVGG
jgi:hypothetical protein